MFYTIIFSCICVGSFFLKGPLVGFYEQFRFSSIRKFEKSEWAKPNLKYRHGALDFVKAEVLRKGMPRGRVLELMGPPDLESATSIRYKAERPGWLPYTRVFGGGLVIDFDHQDRVSDIVVDYWED